MSGITKGIKNPELLLRHLRSRIPDRKIGRLLFDIDRPFEQYAVGKLAIKNAQVKSPSFSSNTTHNYESLTDEGAINLGQIYDEKLINSIQNSFDKFLENHGATYTRGHDGVDYTHGVSTTHTDLRACIPQVPDLINTEIKDVVHSYYDSYFKPVRINIWRNRHVPSSIVSESEVFSNYWHFDPHTTDHLKLFVNLSDVSEDDGPFHYITKTESAEIANDSYNRSEDGTPNGIVEEAANVRKFTGLKGTTAICNTTTNLHRAGIPVEGSQRDLLQMVFAPSSDPLPNDWFDDPTIYSHSGPEHNGFARLSNY
jgi:hypothetical protein